MRRLVSIACACLIAALSAPLALMAPSARAASAQGPLTEWTPVCICRGGHPKHRDQIYAIFIITDANKASLRRKMSEGRLGLSKRARLVGAACGRPKLCGTAYDYRTKKRFPNTPIAGPVTISINVMQGVPVSHKPGTNAYRVDEKSFRVGQRFSIGGKRLAR